MRKTPRKIIVYAVGILLGGLIGGIIYYRFNPAASAVFPKCPFLLITGLKCPGCGSQRAIHALLHFDFGGAFGHNALLLISLPYIALLLVGYMIRYARPQSAFFLRIQRTAIIWTYFALVVVFWISRNILGF